MQKTSETKQTKEDKDPFDEMTDREVLLSLRRNLTKTKGLASSANSRSNEAISDVRNIQNAVIKYLDKVDAIERKMNQHTEQLNKFFDMPWYKRIFYKGERNGSK